MTLHCELDHLVWAAPDLERGVQTVEKLLGARAVIGGRHPGMGTRNALMDVGGGCYLEILAPDPEQETFRGFGLWVAELTTPRLVTWAVRTRDLDAWCQAADAAGLASTPAAALKRQRPSGDELSWRLSALGEDRQGFLPFAIEWGPTHPCDDLPKSGCRLLELRLTEPQPDTLKAHLATLGFKTSPPGTAAGPSEEALTTLSQGPRQLTAIFDTPRGRIELE